MADEPAAAAGRSVPFNLETYWQEGRAMSSLCLGPFLMPSGTGGSVGGDESAPGVGPGWFQEGEGAAAGMPEGIREPFVAGQRLEGVLQRRLTVLQAPVGFGKTTLLADVPRRTEEQGVVVGWISLDDDDTPNVFGGYLAYAFEQGGLDLGVLGSHHAWSSSPAAQQVGMMARTSEPAFPVYVRIEPARPSAVGIPPGTAVLTSASWTPPPSQEGRCPQNRINSSATEVHSPCVLSALEAL